MWKSISNLFKHTTKPLLKVENTSETVKSTIFETEKIYLHNNPETEIEQEELKALLAAKVAEDTNVSRRWEADMSSDSWLSKNIRPMTLIFLLVAYSGFAIASIFEYETRGAYVELLGQWGMLVMSFYFGGRTMEKIADRVKK